MPLFLLYERSHVCLILLESLTQLVSKIDYDWLRFNYNDMYIYIDEEMEKWSNICVCEMK